MGAGEVWLKADRPSPPTSTEVRATVMNERCITIPLGQMAIAVNLQALYQEMATLRHIYLLTIPGLLLAIGGGAWGLAGQAPWRDPGLPSITG